MVREFTSTKTVEGSEYKEPKKIDIDKYWTARAQTHKNFKDAGFDRIAFEEETMGNDHLHRSTQAERFFARVTEEEEKINQKIVSMIRLKANEYYKKGKTEQARVKEYLVYHIELSGYDRWANNITAKLEFEGKSLEPETRLKIFVNADGRDEAKYVFNRLRPKYCITFSKATVDRLLKQTGTDPNDVRYVGYIGHSNNPTKVQFRCIDYSYDQFLLPWDEFEALARQNGGPTGISHWKDKAPAKEWVA